MELVQKLIKKTSKYLFYSPLTEKVLTECPCIKVFHGWCFIMQFYFEINEDDNNFVTRYDFKHIDEFMPLSIISKNCAKIKNALHKKI